MVTQRIDEVAKDMKKMDIENAILHNRDMWYNIVVIAVVRIE